MNLGEFFDSFADYSFEDMQRRARIKEAERKAEEDAKKAAEEAKVADDSDKVVEEKKIDIDGDGDTDVKVTSVESSSNSPEDVAKHVVEKIKATSEFMEPEEFNKLLMGKADSCGSDGCSDCNDKEKLAGMPDKKRASELHKENVPFDENATEKGTKSDEPLGD